MGLLTALNLPKPAAMPGAAPPIVGQPVHTITDTQGVEVGRGGARPIAVKSEPADLKARLDKRDRQLRDAYAKLARLEDALEAESKKDKPDPAMMAQKQDVEKAIASIDRQLKQLDADRKAIANPATDARTMNDIVARAKSPEPIGKAVEVDRHDDPLERSPLKKQTTTTSTEVTKGGQSVTTTSDRKTSVGSDGVTREQTDSRERVTATGTTKTTVGSKQNVGLGGYTSEASKKREASQGGTTSSLEEKNTLQVGPGGVTSTSERKTTAADGSGKGVKTSVGGERGDGKLGGVASTTRTKTDADGHATTLGASGKGGVTSGKDGIGGYGEFTGSIEGKGKNGVTQGAVGGLDPCIRCNVTRTADGDEPKYLLETVIDLGASIKLGESVEKEGSGKVGVSVSGSGRVTMSAKHVLGEAEAAAYVAALKSGSGTQKEMAIIRTGLSQGWPEAQRMYRAMMGEGVGSAAEVDTMKAGESRTFGTKKKGGVGVNADAKGLGVEAGLEKSSEREMTVTKEKDGSATYDTKQGEAEKRKAGASVSVGVVGGGGSIGQTVTTSVGYKFRVKPDMKDARALQDRIAQLAHASAAEVEAFAKAHPECVVERTEVRDDSRQTNVHMSAAGVKGNFMSGAGIEDTVVRDGQGNIVDTRKRGHNEGGLSVSAGKYTIGSSTEEQAGARVGADGERVVDVSKKDTETDTVKFLDALPLVGSKKKDDRGAIAKATGAEEPEDTSTRNVSGMTLSVGDLKALAGKAKDKGAWMNSCPSPRQRDAWSKAGDEIRAAGGTPKAVEDALARFVGSDNLRQKIVMDTVRGKAGDVSGGAAWEFPDSVVGKRKDYEELVLAASEKLVAKKGADEGRDKGEALARDFLARLESLSITVRSAQDFKSLDVKAEMLSAISGRQGRIRIELAKLAGKTQEEAEKGQERAEYERLLEACILHKQNETELFDKIDAEGKRYSKAEAARAIVPLTVQIKNLHSTWQKDYTKLAMLAQENGWGQGHYDKYRPDAARLDHAVKTFSAGVASKPEAETKNYKRDPNAYHADPQKNAARSAEVNQQLNKSEWEQFNTIKKNVEAGYGQAKKLVDELQALLKKAPYPTVMQFFKQGEQSFREAEGNIRRCKPNHMQDMFDYGLAAQEQLKQAIPLLQKAKSFVPKNAPK